MQGQTAEVFNYVDLELRSETNWIHAQTHALVTNAFLSPAAESVLSRSEACMVRQVQHLMLERRDSQLHCNCARCC